MDELSIELHTFLIQLGKEPYCISKQVEHYIEHMLHLLPLERENTLKKFYGLFREQQLTLKVIALELGISENELAQHIAEDLRKIAITPEWQMVKQLII